MQIIEGFDFFPLRFDEHGKLEAASGIRRAHRAGEGRPATDAIFIAHGFRNDEADATNLYTKFLTTLQGPPVASGVRRCCGTAFRRRRRLLAVEAVPEDFDTGAAAPAAFTTTRTSMADVKAQLEDLKNTTRLRRQRRSSRRRSGCCRPSKGIRGAGRVRRAGAFPAGPLGARTRPRACRRSGNGRVRKLLARLSAIERGGTAGSATCSAPSPAASVRS